VVVEEEEGSYLLRDDGWTAGEKRRRGAVRS
jgi:hypothetical protein